MPRVGDSPAGVNVRPREGASAPPAPDVSRPASTLPRFSVDKFWDADSTPPALAAISRAVGGWAPRSGARTPDIEAGVIMASLMHDVAYHYGGSIADKAAADKRFGDQIPYFVSKLNPDAVDASRVTAAADVAAVTLGGGAPFLESYSWSYGFDKLQQRGFQALAPGERTKIHSIEQQTFRQVVDQIADGKFQPSEVLKNKLAAVPPEYAEQIKTNMVKLAKALQVELRKGGSNIPGYR